MIKVIIERTIVPGMESTYEAEAKRTLNAVMGASGFISGTSYIDMNNPNLRTIITNWENIASWNRWFKSELRRDVNYNIAQILEGEEKIKVLMLQSLS
ncbi:antibiotic biosynthesis monooxygenase [Psychrobium sp. 1_MG-2023]|uniref:antibiotic biosynthesis monooxygenase family protein n=1 Tax=Psychrobium sp. 1_MG-2023 TaxID=3062624 RepID=UPI000C34C3CB|nr:antibiotic biosynthesis monooxygenase family protein [Psychrobium sp. 1_MG-2023]MDP2561134.1 antibiotic biosynthesis monooxygenase family protein [Psychrobium sp. 1_MG-2023]PKF55110.1 antibiotic biosynthesis monooxygenase [Alteromonadales bacterium alter-6D02]